MAKAVGFDSGKQLRVGDLEGGLFFFGTLGGKDGVRGVRQARDGLSDSVVYEVAEVIEATPLRFSLHHFPLRF